MKKKLLLVTSTLEPNIGWGTVSFQFKKSLSKKYDLDVLLIKEPQSPAFLRFLWDPFYSFFQYVKHRKAFKDVDYVITSAEPLFKIPGFARMFGAKFKHVLTGYGTYLYFPFIDFPEKYINKFFLHYVDRIGISSNYTISRFKEFSERDVTLLTLGVDFDRYKPVKGVKHENQSFVIAGLQKERKGVDYLFLALQN